MDLEGTIFPALLKISGRAETRERPAQGVNVSSFFPEAASLRLGVQGLGLRVWVETEDHRGA